VCAARWTGCRGRQVEGRCDIHSTTRTGERPNKCLAGETEGPIRTLPAEAIPVRSPA